MALLTKVEGPTAYPAAAIVAAMTVSTPGGDTVLLTGRDILIIQNIGVGARTFTITSQNDPFGRVKHITAQSLAAAGIAVFGPIPQLGWADSTGLLNLASEHAEIKYCVMTLHP